jgi:hypothetical protein
MLQSREIGPADAEIVFRIAESRICNVAGPW